MAAAPPTAGGAVAEAAGVALDAGGRIAADVSCRSCGYNLRAQPIGGSCPECGAAVEASVVGGLLQFSNPAWVARLASGMTFLLAAIACAIASVVVLWVTQVALAVASVSYEVQAAISGAVTTAMGAATLVLALVGVWRVTSPEPFVSAQQGRVRRVLARYGIVVGCGGYYGGWAGMSFTGSDLFILPMLPCAVAWIVGAVAMLFHLRKLALRLGDLRLAKQTRIVGWSLGGLLVLSVALAIVSMVLVFAALASANSSSGSTLEWLWTVPMFGACAALLLAGAFAVWLMVLLVWYRVRLRSAAAKAQAVWVR